ncbi:MAG: MvaI/BcnI family restriction endonuclease [Bacteroidota bacterium]
MERTEAIRNINKIVGRDLRELASNYNVTVFKEGKKNKGWAGHVIERYLGLPINSAQSPNFGSWELKTICLKYLRDKSLTVKETMAVTMIDPYNVERTEFENSHLLAKMQKIVIVARIWESQLEKKSILYATTTFDLENTEIYNQVKADYDLVRETIITKGFSALSGKLGVYIQPRTKGAGHRSTSRAFYARVPFLMQSIFPTLSQR